MGWPPECAPAERLNAPRPLPPAIEKGVKGLASRQTRQGEVERDLERSRQRHLRVTAALARMDNLGIAVCVLEKGGRPVHLSAILHGMAKTAGAPLYLEKIAVARALRVARRRFPGRELADIGVRAGSESAYRRKEKWFAEGAL